MTPNRRKFIRNGALMAMAAFAQPLFANPKKTLFLPKISNGNDEDYWKLVRAHFPLKNTPIYLNNGTLGPSPYAVIEAQHNATMEVDSTGNYGGWEDAVPALAKFVGVTDAEICLTHNVTEGINIVCWGLPLKKGDEIIMSQHEHVGNALPWLNRAKVDGIVIKTIPLAGTDDDILNDINASITSKTKAIALPHIPCTQGQVLPVKRICTLAKEKGLFSFIDGAHGPGMLQLDLYDMGCDFYASCCHKWMLGPKGTGFLFVKKDRLDSAQAKWVGGYSDTGWDMMSSPPAIKGLVDTAHRYYYGSMSTPAYKGVVAAIDFINTIGQEKIEARIKSLATYFYNQLEAIDGGVEILTPKEQHQRAGLVGFRVTKTDHNQFQVLAGKEKIRIRAVSENNVNCVRASFHIYNSFADADALLALIKKTI